MWLLYTKKPPTKRWGVIPSLEQGEKAYHLNTVHCITWLCLLCMVRGFPYVCLVISVLLSNPYPVLTLVSTCVYTGINNAGKENKTYTTDQEAKAMITQAIESGAATADEYDIDQIFDAVFEYDGKGFTQVVDQETFWSEIEKAYTGDHE